MTAREELARGLMALRLEVPEAVCADLERLIERALLDTIEEAKAQQRNLDISIIENAIGQTTPGERRDNIKECWLQYAVHLLRNDIGAAEIRKMK